MARRSRKVPPCLFKSQPKKKNESASSMRNKQRMWVRNGLREIKAPLVPLSCLSKMHILLQGPLKITLEFGVCFLWWWSNSSRSILTWQTKVIAMLCSLIFACDGLDWAPHWSLRNVCRPDECNKSRNTGWVVSTRKVFIYTNWIFKHTNIVSLQHLEWWKNSFNWT